MKPRKKQAAVIFKEEFLWGMAIDYSTKLMLSTTSDGQNVDLRYWKWNGHKRSLYRTSRGVLIPTRCLPSLIDNLTTAEDFIRNDQKNEIIGNSTIIKKMVETAISLWTYTPVASEGENRSVGIEVYEVNSEDVGLWPLGHFIFPISEIPAFINALKTIAEPPHT
jgi:hypothetical protein